MTDLNLQELKTIATSANECRHAWWAEKTLTKALSTGDEPWHDDYAHIAAFSPPTVLALIGRIHELEATLQRVRDLHDEDLFRGHLSNGCKTCEGDHYPCPTIEALGDTK